LQLERQRLEFEMRKYKEGKQFEMQKYEDEREERKNMSCNESLCRCSKKNDFLYAYRCGASFVLFPRCGMFVYHI